MISGYYGAGNAGDEAILAAMLAALRAEIPGAEMVVLSRDPVRTMAEHGVKAVPRDLGRHFFDLVKLFRRADLLLSGGGGLLQDSYPPRFLPASVLYYLAVCLLAKLCGCRVMLYAQGLGPLRRPFARLLLRTILPWMDLIAVRDEVSRDLLHELGIMRRVHLTADPVLAWRPDSLPNPVRSVLPAEKPYLAVSLRPWPEEERWRPVVAGVVERAFRTWGMVPVFLPFARGGDFLVCARVRACMAEGLPAIILPELGPAELYAAVAGAGMVLGMRLHSLIFAALDRVPAVGLAYDPKVTAFLSSLGLAELAKPLRSPEEELWSTLAKTWEKRAEVAARMGSSLPWLAGLALANARLARGLLRED
ncbi:MAG: polysaccharide pyruvyl transferase CsaB [Firmicutes bacterium]|nr:polysaccharide pyruvyl transferase CsaB [Bacillota bacterium]